MDDLMFNKSTDQEQLQVLKQNREDYTEDDFDVEDKCYSKMTKRWLKRLRCDGIAVGEKAAVRPVINIGVDANIKGEGTIDNPYIIVS